jgi:hypothetical protein
MKVIPILLFIISSAQSKLALSENFVQLELLGSDDKENTYKNSPRTEGASSSAPSTDPMTNLGGQVFVMLCLVGIKFWAQCCGVDSPNDGEINNKSAWKLHEAFNYPF